MIKNTASQFFHAIAFDANGRVSGQAANITSGLSIDGGTRVATNDVNPTEIGATGEYAFALTQPESNGHALSFTPACSTSGVQVLGLPSNVIYTTVNAGGLTGPFTRTITITDSVTNAPIQGATVRLFRTGESESKATNASGVVEFATGAFTFTYAIVAIGYAGTIGTIVVAANGATPITLVAAVAPSNNMSLRISYGGLRREIGRFLGFSRDPSVWTGTEPQDVEDVIDAGQRHLYWPPVAEGLPSHLWSFLCPSADVSLVAGTRSYALPADFVRLRSDFTFKNDSGHRRIQKIDEADIRSLWAKSSQVGIPHYCAIRTSSNLAVEGYELLVYPEPESNLEIEYRYEKAPSKIDSDNPYHLGPASHSELLLSACLMVADKMLNSESIAPDGGIHAQRFFRQLSASIALDLQVS